jgi:hypothetical protein
LAVQVGQASLRDVEIQYRRVMADLSAATAAHQWQSVATYRAELSALCAPSGLTQAIEPCNADSDPYFGGGRPLLDTIGATPTDTRDYLGGGRPLLDSIGAAPTDPRTYSGGGRPSLDSLGAN